MLLLPATVCLALAPSQGRPTRRDALQLATTSAAGVLLPPSSSIAAEASTAATRQRLALPRLGLGAWAWGDTLFWGYDKSQDAALSDVFNYALDKGDNHIQQPRHLPEHHRVLTRDTHVSQA